MTYSREHHQEIEKILFKFNGDFFQQNEILFGGGTRIALELDEFRESVDIDFFCVGQSAFRAARSTITNISFGSLLLPGETLDLFPGREIRADRDAIRTVLGSSEKPIKLEIIKFENDRITSEIKKGLFPIPCVSQEGCFSTKLTANADRFSDSIKDILDLCMMRYKWGEIPPQAWDIACEEYGENVIKSGLYNALHKLIKNERESLNNAVDSLHIEESLAKEIIRNKAPAWLEKISKC